MRLRDLAQRERNECSPRREESSRVVPRPQPSDRKFLINNICLSVARLALRSNMRNSLSNSFYKFTYVDFTFAREKAALPRMVDASPITFRFYLVIDARKTDGRPAKAHQFNTPSK